MAAAAGGLIYVIGNVTDHLYAVRDRGAIEVTQAISFLRRVATRRRGKLTSENKCFKSKRKCHRFKLVFYT